jgi:hypothetical protein
MALLQKIIPESKSQLSAALWLRPSYVDRLHTAEKMVMSVEK